MILEQYYTIAIYCHLIISLFWLERKIDTPHDKFRFWYQRVSFYRGDTHADLAHCA